MTEFAKQWVDSGAAVLGDRPRVIKAVRALFRYFGGQLLYIPQGRGLAVKSKRTETIFGLLADELGDKDAERIGDAWLKYFGGAQNYIPQEDRAFRDEIAAEIYRRYDGTQECMSDLCQEYRVSFAQVYKLYHHGKDLTINKKQRGLFDDLQN